MSWRKLIGFVLLIISCIAWAVLPVLPFLPYEAEELAAFGGAVFVFAEVTWWLAIPFLGREMFDFAKQYLLKIIASLKDEPKE